ncbi:MAG: hypothetical protein CR982_08350 [Candidatus Cloacimonadota bacterium]|nr:MAG: hypothetical protein CR982_08350 [Candidatus Cloacimonadota bacterium]PIE79062.1 MAG: hypothetical protein CSA15_04795 [Candidatus Delongbacteria bacterium]
MKNFISILLLLSLLFTLEGKWLSGTPANQIKEEGLDDHLGKGRLFIPCMSNPKWEVPKIFLYKRNQKFNYDRYRVDCKFGKSTFLDPGYYRIVFGTAESQMDMLTEEFSISSGETFILEQNWASLLVKVIDENREEVRISYDIYEFDGAREIGSKYSIDQTDFEKQRDTWILRPGKYKIVKSGEPFNTIVNFVTIELEKGDLYQFTIVVDSDTREFRGFGELLGESEKEKSNVKWQERLTLKGAFSLNSNNIDSEKDSQTEANFNGKIKNRLKYDVKPWLINLNQIFETDLRKSNEDDIRVINDRFDLTNTAIFYFTDIFGFYGELSLRSEIFSNTNYFSEDKNIKKIYSSKVETFEGVSDIEVSPVIFPLTTGEEIGFNFHLLNEPRANLYFRTGIGMEQTNNNNVFEESGVEGNYTIYKEIDNNYINGLVFSAGSDFRVFSNLNYESEVRFIKSFTKADEYNFNWENNFTFNIFQYLSLEYNIDFQYSDKKDYLVWKHNLLLEFSYYFTN